MRRIGNWFIVPAPVMGCTTCRRCHWGHRGRKRNPCRTLPSPQYPLLRPKRVSRAKPTADVEIGHRTVTVGHLINIAREVGRQLRWDPDKEQVVDDPEANALLDRPRRKGWELPDVR